MQTFIQIQMKHALLRDAIASKLIILYEDIQIQTFAQKHSNNFFWRSPCASPHCPESPVEHLQPVELLHFSCFTPTLGWSLNDSLTGFVIEDIVIDSPYFHVHGYDHWPKKFNVWGAVSHSCNVLKVFHLLAVQKNGLQPFPLLSPLPSQFWILNISLQRHINQF